MSDTAPAKYQGWRYGSAMERETPSTKDQEIAAAAELIAEFRKVHQHQRQTIEALLAEKKALERCLSIQQKHIATMESGIEQLSDLKARERVQ